MTLKAGLASQIGFADETVWGTAVAPTVFLPLVDESLTYERERIESAGIIAGRRVIDDQQWDQGNVNAAGDVGLELHDQSTGLLFKHMFGGTSLVGPFTPADMTGNGLTVQVGVPDTTAGVVRPKTFAGCKVTSWEIGCTVGEYVTLGLSLMGRHSVSHRTVADGATTSGSPNITSATAAFNDDDVDKPISGAGIPAGTTVLSVTSATAAVMSANATATASGVTFTIGMALTSVSYTAGARPFTYLGGTVTVAGTTYKARSLTLAGDNGFEERRFVGQKTTDEPLEAALRAYTGTIDSEYWDNTMFNRFVSGAEAALVLTLVRGARSVTVTTNVRFDGESPQVGGPGIVGQSIPVKCIGPSSDAGAITVTLVT
jgi:hypothetical protein